MTGKTLLYRGSLKSCNYRCSYCPFSKHPQSARELAADREQWLSLAEDLAQNARLLGIRALMAVPYGEALIHPWYWEGLARISAQPEIDAVGAQTNASFPIAESLAHFRQNRGNLQKLHLWATFHPEMTTPEAFAQTCAALTEEGISLCAGAVGVPENISILQSLRKALPPDTYLWINRMDGLVRPYTAAERVAFLEIDPYFLRELAPVPANPAQCTGRLFLEGNGRLHTCSLSTPLRTNWKSLCANLDFPQPQCRRKLCSCYLAYGGRNDFMNQVLFGPYPLFRIPRRPKAAFFDIDGTLLPKTAARPRTLEHAPAYTHSRTLEHAPACTHSRTLEHAPACTHSRTLESAELCAGTSLPEDILAGLTALSREQIPLFFATALPYPAARKRCQEIWPLFSGGIFASGAHLALFQNGREKFYYLDAGASCLAALAPLAKPFRFRILPCKNQGNIYKLTLLRPSRLPWQPEEAQALMGCLPPPVSEKTRYFLEGNCLQIVAAQADKANGVRTLCQWIGISPTEAAAAGDSPEDAGMLVLCSR